MTKTNRAKKVRSVNLTKVAMQLQVSDWSNPNKPPTKSGVYEIKPEYSTGHRMFAYWDGKTWFGESESILHAEHHADCQEARNNQQVTWRGIIK